MFAALIKRVDRVYSLFHLTISLVILGSGVVQCAPELLIKTVQELM